MPPRRANARNANARNENASPPIPHQEVSNAKFRNAIQMLAQNMTNQNNQVRAHANKNGGSVDAGIRDFVKMTLPEFLGAQTNEVLKISWTRSRRSLR